MNKYSSYTPEQLEEHLSNFLIDSWSYSRVASFSRNEKNFEKEEIYGERGRKGVSAVAGSAYHAALEHYFSHFSDTEQPDLVELQQEAYAYIDRMGADEWKTGKTTPTVEDCIGKATAISTALVSNFLAEADSVTSDISEVIGVELRCDEWLTVNGVDIPLPCHAYIDLACRTADGRVVIIDHKSKSAFTDEKEIALCRGKQAITYTLCLESQLGITVDEVRFVENKYSKNKNGEPQLRVDRIVMDADSRTLYETMLYEPLKRMLQAVSDPDYVYLANDSDTLCDKAELYDFWARTLISEVDDFRIPENKKDLIRKRQRKIRDASIAAVSPQVISSFRRNAAAFISFDIASSDMTKQEKIEHVLRTFGKICRVAHTIEGYSSDTYLLEMSAGVKIADIAKYKLDIANALNLPTVRIPSTLTVYRGQSYLPVEAARDEQRSAEWSAEYLEGVRIPIGRDNYGNLVSWDLANPSTPHMLVCGATGSGKSVCLRSTLEYALLADIPAIVLDPKYEFLEFGTRAMVCNEIEDIEEAMKRLVAEMQGRVRRHENSLTLVIFDEFADALAQSRSGRQLDIREIDFMTGKTVTTGKEKSLEENLRMLAQKGRSVGFRIVAATQRASTKIITGDTKTNFPVQVCFRMPKALDSRIVLDEDGAESLKGHGDGLMRSPEYDGTVRFQGFYKR